jgi:2,4-dienoyl-CoA reductase-like NADH-dependent reductase (Old Yellow Enzyme family)/thioredoxin reductase
MKPELLRKPLKIGNLEINNRIVMAPMGIMLWSVTGEVTPQGIAYHAMRARGGAGLITIGIMQVQGAEWGSALRLDDDRYIAGLKKLTAAIHADGAHVIAQLHHGGPSAHPSISPSGVPVLSADQEIIVPRAMTLEEIEEMRERYVGAAIRAKAAGFDGVQPHGAATYLLQQFFSPKTNTRNDRYGGNLENRMRLQLEIVRGIREKCGSNFVIGFALVASDYVPGGITLEESVVFGQALEQAGIDYLDIRAGTHETFVASEQGRGHSKYQPRTGIWEFSEPFKKAVKVPVFCSTSGCYNPALWEEALKAGKADAVSLAKPFLADADISGKVVEGRFEEIRPCVLCLNCLDFFAQGNLTPCSINPELVMNPGPMPMREAPRISRKIVVVGGGPAGLEAARLAASKGHQVRLIEKETELGGNMKIAGLCSGNDLLLRLRDWMVGQCGRAGVKFDLGKEAKFNLVESAKPDVVILATGASRPIIPPIKGIDQLNLVTPGDVLSGKVKAGNNIVVLGGNFIGIETAITIAMKDPSKNVNVVEPWPVATLGYDMSTLNRTYVSFVMLPKFGVHGFVGLKIDEFTGAEMIGTDRDGKKQRIKADTIIVALGSHPDMTLYESLRGGNWELKTIGNCSRVNSVANAIAEAAQLVRQL